MVPSSAVVVAGRARSRQALLEGAREDCNTQEAKLTMTEGSGIAMKVEMCMGEGGMCSSRARGGPCQLNCCHFRSETSIPSASKSADPDAGLWIRLSSVLKT